MLSKCAPRKTGFRKVDRLPGLKMRSARSFAETHISRLRQGDQLCVRSFARTKALGQFNDRLGKRTDVALAGATFVVPAGERSSLARL